MPDEEIQGAVVKKLNVKKTLAVLHNDWGGLITRFHGLNLEEQQAYLHAQGYKRFADLLAHFCAWWERGIAMIRNFQQDSGFSAPEVEVDDFNAAAVARAQGLSEEEVERVYNRTLQRFEDLIASLSVEDQKDKRIIRQIEIELIGHYQEHQIK